MLVAKWRVSGSSLFEFIFLLGIEESLLCETTPLKESLPTNTSVVEKSELQVGLSW